MKLSVRLIIKKNVIKFTRFFLEIFIYNLIINE